MGLIETLFGSVSPPPSLFFQVLLVIFVGLWDYAELEFLVDKSEWPHDGAKSLVVYMAFQNCLQIPSLTEMFYCG